MNIKRNRFYLNFNELIVVYQLLITNDTNKLGKGQLNKFLVSV